MGGSTSCPSTAVYQARLITSSRSSLDRDAGLLFPPFDVHAHHEEPQEHRRFPEEAAGQIVGGQKVYERV